MSLAVSRPEKTAAEPPQALDPEAPKRLGRYEIVQELGRGAMGVVYKAHDPVLDRFVAIKTISLELPKSERAEYEARFYQEARAAGRLNHPNIVTIYDIGRTDRLAYMAMEFLEGQELRTRLTPGTPISVLEAIDIAEQVAEGLAYAHEARVVHRDIKPSNVMVVRDGWVKIMDFGIARLHESEVKTMTGLIMGSPKYMSPEQVTGARPDQRSDVFSLGVMLYETLTGSSPFSGESIHSIMYQIIHFTPPPPSQINRQVPEMLDLIVAKALSKKLDERYANAKELSHDLRLCRDFVPTVTPDGDATQPAPKLSAQQSASTIAGTVVTMRQEVPQSWDEVEEIHPPASGRKVYGVSKAFDSREATQRLAAFSPASAKPENAPAASAARPRGGPAPTARSSTSYRNEIVRLAKSRWIWIATTCALAGALVTMVLSHS